MTVTIKRGVHYNPIGRFCSVSLPISKEIFYELFKEDIIVRVNRLVRKDDFRTVRSSMFYDYYNYHYSYVVEPVSTTVDDILRALGSIGIPYEALVKPMMSRHLHNRGYVPGFGHHNYSQTVPIFPYYKNEFLISNWCVIEFLPTLEAFSKSLNTVMK